MKRRLVILFSFILILFNSTYAIGAQKWWHKWSNFPNVPRITVEKVQQLMNRGEKVIFIYTGYKVKEVVCGSLYIPYTLVPPADSGSRIKIDKIPKDWWILCY